MKRLYSRFVLWLIRPALERESRPSASAGLIFRSALEVGVIRGAGDRGNWTIDKSGKLSVAANGATDHSDLPLSRRDSLDNTLSGDLANALARGDFAAAATASDAIVRWSMRSPEHRAFMRQLHREWHPTPRQKSARRGLRPVR